jgi:hypothetical protein
MADNKDNNEEEVDLSFFRMDGSSDEEDTSKDEGEEGENEEEEEDKEKKEVKTETKKDKSKDEKPKEDKPKVEAKEKKEAKPKETPKNEEPEEEDEEVDFVPLVKEIFEKIDIPWDDDYLPKDKNSMEGFVELIEELIEENSTPQYASTLSQQFDEHLSKGGDPKKFFELHVDRPDYSKVKIETVAEQKMIVKEHLKRTSKMSDARIEKLIETMVIDKEIETEAKSSLKELQELDEADRKEEKLKLEAKEKADKEKARADNDKIMNLLDKGGVPELGFDLDKKTRDAFKAFLFNTDSTGKTQYRKLQEKIPNLQFRLAYLAFAGIYDEKALGQEGKTKAIDNAKRSVLLFNQKKQGGSDKQKQKVTESNGTDFNFFRLDKN